MKFLGNKICCGSYACLNAMKKEGIDLDLFEISTSTPFGIRHSENQWFDRLLTTYRDPNEGMNEALKLWGFQCDFIQTKIAENIIAAIRTRLADQTTAVLGPINMDKLMYQIEPQLLFRMDHYVTLYHCSDDEVWLTDSEGFSMLKLPLDTLADWINVDRLPEAHGYIMLRIIRRHKEYNKKLILMESLRRAARNLSDAERTGHGSLALISCSRFLSENKSYNWRLSFLYDLEYLHQRKALFRVLLKLTLQAGIISTNTRDSLDYLITWQMDMLSDLYQSLMFDNCILYRKLEMLGDSEKELTAIVHRLIDL